MSNFVTPKNNLREQLDWWTAALSQDAAGANLTGGVGPVARQSTDSWLPVVPSAQPMMEWVDLTKPFPSLSHEPRVAKPKLKPFGHSGEAPTAKALGASVKQNPMGVAPSGISLHQTSKSLGAAAAAPLADVDVLDELLGSVDVEALVKLYLLNCM